MSTSRRDALLSLVASRWCFARQREQGSRPAVKPSSLCAAGTRYSSGRSVMARCRRLARSGPGARGRFRNPCGH